MLIRTSVIIMLFRPDHWEATPAMPACWALPRSQPETTPPWAWWNSWPKLVAVAGSKETNQEWYKDVLVRVEMLSINGKRLQPKTSTHKIRQHKYCSHRLLHTKKCPCNQGTKTWSCPMFLLKEWLSGWLSWSERRFYAQLTTTCMPERTVQKLIPSAEQSCESMAVLQGWIHRGNSVQYP